MFSLKHEKPQCAKYLFSRFWGFLVSYLSLFHCCSSFVCVYLIRIIEKLLFGEHTGFYEGFLWWLLTSFLMKLWKFWTKIETLFVFSPENPYYLLLLNTFSSIQLQWCYFSHILKLIRLWSCTFMLLLLQYASPH